MNDTLKAIATRYSCRNFTGQMPTDDQLEAIAKAAVQAPSAMNRQPWRVIVVKNQALIADMEAEGMRILFEQEDKSAYNRIMSRGGTVFYHTPCVIVVPIDSAASGAAMDCGILVENIALAATSLGLGSVICGLMGLVFSGDKAAEFKERLGFPAGFEFGSSVLLGYAQSPANAHEPDLLKISYVE